MFPSDGDRCFFLSGTLVAQVKATSTTKVTYELLSAGPGTSSSTVATQTAEDNTIAGSTGGSVKGPVFRVDQDGRIVVNQKPDRETKDSYTLTILAQTQSSPPLTAMVDVTIKIMDENDNAPEFQSVPYHVTVAESVEVGGTVLRGINTRYNNKWLFRPFISKAFTSSHSKKTSYTVSQAYFAFDETLHKV